MRYRILKLLVWCFGAHGVRHTARDSALLDWMHVNGLGA